MSERFEALLLAAGAARRFGAQKLLQPLGGVPLAAAALHCALAAPARSVLVVVGADAAAVEAALRRAGPTDGRLRFVAAPNYMEGMSASLKVGLAALPADAAGVFVFLADMPLIPPAVPPLLVAGIGSALAAAPSFKGRRGHPALLRRALFPRLQALSGDEGARRVLESLGPELAIVDTEEEGVLFDVDRPEDLQRVREA